MKISVLLPAALLLVWASSCNYMSAHKKEVATNAVAQVSASKQEEKLFSGNMAADSTAQETPAPPQVSKDKTSTPNPDWDKKIIRNANLNIEVKNYRAFNELVRNAVRQAGGYIAQEEQNESSYKIENSMTIKVPVARFDEVCQALAPSTEKVMMKKITSEDVTGEVVDTKARLEAKKEVRLRYLELLRQAKNMKEILEVQQEINEIQENMEAAAGRINYLSHAAAMSTIQLNFYQVLDVKANDVTEPGFGQKVLLALNNGLQWLGELLVVVLNLWPLWLALGLAWYGYKRHRGQLARAKAAVSKNEA